MDNQVCDKHPSARAQAKVILPSLGTLFFCGHCANGFTLDYDGEFHIMYEAIELCGNEPA